MVWHNGQLVHASEVCLSPFDQGLTIGLGAFETLIAIGTEPFAFSRHWQRLQYSCRQLQLPLPDRTTVHEALREVTAANNHVGGRLRVTVTPGAGPPGAGRATTSPPTYLVTTAPRPVWPATARVITLPWPRNEHSPLSGIKSTSYAECSLGLAHARHHGADEAVFPNTQGHLCEGTSSNVFVVENNGLVTPPLSDGCLGGVTRALVIELATTLGIPVRESSIPIADWPHATEAFLTSSTRNIQPISRIDSTALPQAPGPLTAQLISQWHDRQAVIIDP
jgi:branched-chain amino acid aminotransferase